MWNSPYPGQRQQPPTGAPSFVAPVIRGSIQAPAITRQAHLNSFLNDDALKRSTRKISTDDSTYDTVFQSIYGDTLILRIHWPALTPSTQVPPKMTLAGAIATHPWLDSGMNVIGYEPIQDNRTWERSRILLGTAVHEVVKNLQVHPPEIIEITDSHLKAIQKPKTPAHEILRRQIGTRVGGGGPTFSPVVLPGTSPTPLRTGSSPTQPPMRSIVMENNVPRPPLYDTNSVTAAAAAATSTAAPPCYESTFLSQQEQQQQQKTKLPPVDMPPIPSRFEQLDAITSREELEKLLNDDVEFKLFCNNQLPITETYRKIHTSVIEENVQQAKKNLQRQEELQQLHTEVVALQKTFKENVDEFLAYEKEQNKLCEPPDIKIVIKSLTKAKKDAFDESEQIAEEWLDNDAKNIDEFLNSFIPKRKLHHERSAKMELLKLQQHQQQQQQQQRKQQKYQQHPHSPGTSRMHNMSLR